MAISVKHTGKTALIIIDMQKGGFKINEPKFHQDKVVSNINHLIKIFRKSQLPIIIIQHDGTRERAFVPNTTDWEILDELNQSDTDIIISKTANSAFYKSSLNQTLKELGSESIYLCGWATDFCVDATAKSAINHDYDVKIVSDAHTCSERPHASAKQVIDHFNWVWSNLTPTDTGKITVTSTEEIIGKFQI